MNMTTSPYCIERVRDETGLHALQEPWTALLAEAGQTPVFLTWEWISTWWRHYGHEDGLWLLAATDPAGRLIALAPWMRVRQHLGALGPRAIRFIGSGLVCPSHLCIIARPADQERACAALLAYLNEHQHQWDVLDLEAVALEWAAGTHLAERSGRMLERPSLICPYVALPDSWDAYHATLKKKLRRNLKYFHTLLEREHPGQADFDQVVDAGELDAAIDSLTAMLQKRRDDSSFYDLALVGFHREMAALGLARGWLRFYQLRIGDQPIAALYCFRYGDVVYAYQIGFDLAWARYSPGRLLIGYALEQSIREGAREFDWLRGEHDYKFEWTDQCRVDLNLLYSKTPPGRLWLYGVDLFERARPLGRRILAQPWGHKLERLIAGRRGAPAPVQAGEP
jgi:CelD/BcsL family acetyltransferase involved in cellulose biosynthesis